MTFTMENTEGYSQAQLDFLNSEMAIRLAEVDPNDTDALRRAEKAFSDDVGRGAFNGRLADIASP